MNITIKNTDMKIENEKLIINIDSEIEKVLKEEKIVRLGDLEIGSVINGKYVVVEQDPSNKRTAVVRKEVLDERMEFGVDNNWKFSALREYLNKKYYAELCNEFGMENIETHEVYLLSMDGNDEYGVDTCFVSVMTVDRYRKYHKLIGNAEYTEWLSTPNRTKESGDTTFVQCVNDDGSVVCGVCNLRSRAARPFFVLKSSIFVSINDTDQEDNCKHMRDGLCRNGASSTGNCKTACSYYEK